MASSRASSPSHGPSISESGSASTGARYDAFGLDIESDVELGPPQRGPAGPAAARVVVHAGGAPRESGAVTIAWDGVCELAATGGSILDVYPRTSASEHDTQLAVAGAGLALLLHQRGRLVLHGSCVDIGGRAVAVVGVSGAGKSTVARAIVAAGHGLVSDGMTVVQLDDGVPRVARGLPVLKLWPDAAQAFGYHPSSLPRVHAQSEKLLCDASPLLVKAPGTLATIVVLASGERPRLEPMRPSAAAFELARHFFLSDELGSACAERVLRDCAKLAGLVKVARLERAGLAALDEVVTLITEYARMDPPH